MIKIFFILLISFFFASNCFSQNTDSTSTDTCQVDIPRTITPNGDGINDVWCITSNCSITLRGFELWMFDRWGNMIWHTKDIKECWDMTAKNGDKKTPVKEDVYVWKLTYLKLIDGKDPEKNGASEKKSHVGHVTVIR